MSCSAAAATKYKDNRHYYWSCMFSLVLCYYYKKGRQNNQQLQLNSLNQRCQFYCLIGFQQRSERNNATNTWIFHHGYSYSGAVDGCRSLAQLSEGGGGAVQWTITLTSIWRSNVDVSALWEEARVRGQKPHSHREVTQTPHRPQNQSFSHSVRRRHTCTQSPRTRVRRVASSLTELNSSVHHISCVVRRYVVLTGPETC